MSRSHWGQFRFNPAKGLRHHLDCASDSGYLSTNSHPSYFESCSQGQPPDLSGPPCGYVENAQVAKESPKEKKDRSEQSKAVWLGCVKTEQPRGSRPGVNDASHRYRILVLCYAKGNSPHVSEKPQQLLSSNQLLALQECEPSVQEKLQIQVLFEIS